MRGQSPAFERGRSLVRALTALSVAVLVGWSLTLALGLFVPVYTDEVASKAQVVRPLVEGGRVLTLFPQCPSSWSAPLPATWAPAALLYYLAFGKLGLLGYRIASLVVALAWLLGVAWVLARTTRSRAA